jgi:hypothetical protein
MLVVRGVARCGYHMVSQYCWGMVYHGTITEHILKDFSLKDFSADKEAGSWSSVDHQSTLIWATVLDIAGHSGCRIQQNGHPQLEPVGSSKRANPPPHKGRGTRRRKPQLTSLFGGAVLHSATLGHVIALPQQQVLGNHMGWSSCNAMRVGGASGEKNWDPEM